MPRQIQDPKQPDSQVRITDFQGMSPGTDQHANPPGASWFQVNCVSLFPGELRARRGFKVVRFDQPSRSNLHDCFASSSYVLSAAGVSVVAAGDITVTAASSYVMSNFASTDGSFDLMGTL